MAGSLSIIDREEYNKTVVAFWVALADIENSDQWPTSEEVFSELRQKSASESAVMKKHKVR